MRKISLLLFISMLLLASCNLPQNQVLTESLQVETAVAETLTAQPALPLETLQAEISTQPVDPTAGITPSPEITATPTESPSPTATPLADDPAVALGDPTWERGMSNGTAFGIDDTGYEDESTRIVVANDVMTISSNSTIGFRGWRLTSPTPQNMYLEATFITRSCSGSDAFGIVARAKDYVSGQGYYFGINCDGQYGLSRWTDQGTSSVVSGKSDPIIRSGSGQTNRIGILIKENKLSLYVNGKLLETVEDSSIPDGGHIGVYISGYSGNLTVDMDKIAYWDLK